MLDGFGVTGVEGAFRTACELSMRILRHNKDCLRTILDAYIHDPLAQWQDDMMELVSAELLVIISPDWFSRRRKRQMRRKESVKQ